jgi:desampylase
MGSAVIISRSLLDAVLADARADPTRERCGLLLGKRDGKSDAVIDFVPAANVHANPARQFELDPAVLVAAWRAERAGGLAVLGHYHSHPVGEAIPSVADAAAAEADGRLWLIVARKGFSMWRSVADGSMHGRFESVTIERLDRSVTGQEL